MLELVALVAQIVRCALGDQALAPLTPGEITRLEFELRRSSEGDVFWRVDRVDVRLRTHGVIAGVIERYDP